MLQSFTTAPSLPTQPVPVPALPKPMTDSEREFTDLKMALDHLLYPHAELSEHYKYRDLMEQLVLEEARLIAQSFRHNAQPYTAAMQALQRGYGQPHQLAQGEIAATLNSPDVRAGDFKAFLSFALRVGLLVGMLTSIEGPNGMELMSTGHVDRLLSKLPRHLRDGFIEHLQVRGRLQMQSLNPYNLRDLTEWLKVKVEAQRLPSKFVSNGKKSLHTYVILDDGAKRTIILTEAIHHLGLTGELKSMALRTIRQDVAHIQGSSVSFHIASPAQPGKRHVIIGAFSANRLSLAEQSYPVPALLKRYRHLRGIPIQPFSNAQPLFLIGADNTHLIAAKEPVRLGPSGGPVAVHTELGWALQGPDGLMPHQVSTNCYFTRCRLAPDDLDQHVERL